MKKEVKKIIAVVLAVVLTFGSGMIVAISDIKLPTLLSLKADAAETSDTCGYNLYWSFDESTGELTITGSGDMYDYRRGEVAPWCDYQSQIVSISLPLGLTSIGSGAFEYCTNLTSITIPDTVMSIGSDAFYDTGYYNNNSNWTDDVLYIDNCLIKAKDNISGEYSIKEGTRLIADSAFKYSRSLANIDVDSNNTAYSSQDGVLFNKDKTKLILYPRGNSRTTYVVPDSVTSIGDCAFESCENLTIITISDSVVSIGECAFLDCYNLTNITIGNSVTSIGERAFEYCYNLTNITIPNSVTSIGDYAFEVCGNLTNVTIGNGVTSIGSGAFYYCSSLTSIDVDSNNTAYSGQDGVLFNKDKTELIQHPAGNSRTSHTIPSSVTSIDSWAFYQCTSLTSITIPDNVTSIDHYVFFGCENLTNITIPDSVTSIGEYTFYGCTSLTNIDVAANNIAYSSQDGILFNKDKTVLIQYPIGNSRTSYVIPDSVTNIDCSAFDDCTNLTSVTIPVSVTSIGSHAFAYCTSLRDVYYNGSIEDWEMIINEGGNECLTDAKIHFAENNSLSARICRFFKKIVDIFSKIFGIFK